jgi:alkylation response protein AidB-like acyl-CoA dehydrogenase
MPPAASVEQRLLAEQARDVLQRRSAALGRVGLADAGPVERAALYRELSELGWTAALLPAELGGLGLPAADLAPVARELGRQVTPPVVQPAAYLVSAAVSAAPASAARDLLAAALVAGTEVVTTAIPGIGDGPAPVLDTGHLTGSVRGIPEADIATWLLVTADDAGTTTLVVLGADAPGVRTTPLRCIDPTQRMFTVHLDHVAVSDAAVLATGAEAHTCIAASFEQSAAMYAAELCGVAEAAMEMAVAYAKERRQFGRTIGSFQAVAHRCAQMLPQLDSADALTAAALAALTQPAGQGDAEYAVSLAKTCASSAARAIAASSIQVHGGIGFTWEHDAHLYLKRAHFDALAAGDDTIHRRRIAQHLGILTAAQAQTR